MTVQKVATLAEFNNLISSNPGKLIVVDFTATWCGPCQFIKPIFHQLAEENTGSIFVQVDVDENSETAEEVGVSAMPTFFFYKDGNVVEQFAGANADKLKASVQKHAWKKRH